LRPAGIKPLSPKNLEKYAIEGAFALRISGMWLKRGGILYVKR